MEVRWRRVHLDSPAARLNTHPSEHRRPESARVTAAPTRDAYDAVVIGSGLGGLSAAAFLADTGRRVVVLERSEQIGGYAHAFWRGPYQFDPAIHMIGAGEGLLLTKILRYLGVSDLAPLIPTGISYDLLMPDLRLRVPSGLEEYLEAHTRHFPSTRQELVDFLALCTRVHNDVHRLPPNLSLQELGEAVPRFPTLFQYLSTPVQQMLDDTIHDRRLQTVVTALWPWFGLPPSKLSVLTWTTPYLTLINEGPFQCEGGAHRLAEALAIAVTRRGGELVTGCEVTNVPIEGNAVSGVRTADGRELAAPLVVSSADAYGTFSKLVGFDRLPDRFVRRLDRMRVSISGFQLYVATSLDLDELDVATMTFVYDGWDHDSAYRDAAEGRPSMFWTSIPTRLDPTLAPPGEHIVIVTMLADAANGGRPWKETADAYRELTLERLERVFPGIQGRLSHVETATPVTLERYSANRAGALYGWENAPDQSGSRRLGHRTPIDGLYLSGHWTQPGSGAFRTIFSGIETMLTIEGGDYAEAFLRRIGLIPTL